MSNDRHSRPLRSATSARSFSFASSYTRGQGFTDGVPNSDVRAAILTCAARLVAHPRQVGLTELKGPESYQLYHAPVAWSLAELAVPNRYRERAQ